MAQKPQTLKERIAVFAALFSLLSSLPKFLGLAERVAMWISRQVTLSNQRKADRELAASFDRAKKEKDTKDLDNFFKGEP